MGISDAEIITTRTQVKKNLNFTQVIKKYLFSRSEFDPILISVIPFLILQRDEDHRQCSLISSFCDDLKFFSDHRF